MELPSLNPNPIFILCGRGYPSCPRADTGGCRVSNDHGAAAQHCFDRREQSAEESSHLLRIIARVTCQSRSRDKGALVTLDKAGRASWSGAV